MRVAGAVARVATLNLGSHTTRGAQCCSLKGLHCTGASQWACVGLVYQLVIAG